MRLSYTLIRSDRKTIALILDRDNEIIVRAPFQAAPDRIERFFQSKQEWIYTKMELKRISLLRYKEREYVAGEGFQYLGRTYKLKLVDNPDVTLRLHNNGFELDRAEAYRWREIFLDWYKEQCKLKLPKRIRQYSEKFNLIPSKVAIKELKNKWGSCTHNNAISINWLIILAPISVIDYVIIHELAHIKEKNHSPKFWTQLWRLLPDYEHSKDWLRRNEGGMIV